MWGFLNALNHGIIVVAFAVNLVEFANHLPSGLEGGVTPPKIGYLVNCLKLLSRPLHPKRKWNFCRVF